MTIRTVRGHASAYTYTPEWHEIPFTRLPSEYEARLKNPAIKHLSSLPFSDRRIINGLRQRYDHRVAKIKRAYKDIVRGDYSRKTPYTVME